MEFCHLRDEEAGTFIHQSLAQDSSQTGQTACGPSPQAERDSRPEIRIWQQVWEQRAPGHVGREPPQRWCSARTWGGAGGVGARALTPFPVLFPVSSNLEDAAVKVLCLSAHTSPPAAQARKKRNLGSLPSLVGQGALREWAWELRPRCPPAEPKD